eukprot:TRINITY_DN44446_c0_g1_i1.p1 TRINITY_DN44446_c0_g1~~TRINITY_DN44446_c0_g1_i1.p1  ORF type:complete len:461 (+),score=90.78 TRINITY_DN44446_c0_g1_i1:57-1439(+)
MKFGKTLLEELSHDWNGSCFDYKGLKKVIKVIMCDPKSAPNFGMALEAELFRIQEVMLRQEELLRAEVVGLQPYQAGQPLAALFFDEGKVATCSSIVRKIESFKRYASLTSTGVRKIIKKFDKRLRLDFREHYGLPPVANWLVSERDVGSWLLAPASNCLRLLGRLLVETPLLSLRQYRFWAADLQHGLQLTRIHIENLRQDEELCVRNTFVELKQRGEESAVCHRRAFSCPRIVEATIMSQVQEETQHASVEQSPAREEGHCEDTISTGLINMATSSASCSGLLDVGQASLSAEDSSLAGYVDIDPRSSSASSSSQRRMPLPRGSASRWWTAVREACPLSGFPIAGLPYPPFKFRDGTRRNQLLLVDAQYLALSVMSTLEFHALGRALTSEDLQAVDAHMKRCKLGNLRLGQALQLLHTAGPEAAQELKALQLRAQKRLKNLQHIQRTRLMRADNQVQT